MSLAGVRPPCILPCVRTAHVIFAKGYGYSAGSNAGTSPPRRHSSPPPRLHQTLKLFTWTSVCRLVEQGKLDATGRQPVTHSSTSFPPFLVTHQPFAIILTHTSGYEEPAPRSFRRRRATSLSLINTSRTACRSASFPLSRPSPYANYATPSPLHIVQPAPGHGPRTLCRRNI